MPVYKDKKSGKWYYEFSYQTITGETRRRKKRGFELKKDAKDAEALEKIKLKDAPPSSMTFGQLYEIYLEAKHHEWLPGSESSVRDHIDIHVMPTFSEMRIDEITTKQIESWKLDMYSKERETSKGPQQYAITTLNNIRRDFSAVFNYAINHQLLQFNPVKAVPGFKDPNIMEESIEKQIWTPEEFSQFMDVVDSEIWYVFFAFLWVTGVRIGEAQGIMYRDIDFKNNRVVICKSIYTKQKGKSYVINPTKTKKTRIIELPGDFVELLKPYFERGTKIDGWTADKFLFGFDRPLPNSTIDRARNKYIELAGVKIISSHGFRHSHATYLLANGIDIKSVSQRLGHKDVHETLNTYVHVLPVNKSRILGLVSESLKICANFTPQVKETA